MNCLELQLPFMVILQLFLQLPFSYGYECISTLCEHNVFSCDVLFKSSTKISVVTKLSFSIFSLYFCFQKQLLFLLLFLTLYALVKCLLLQKRKKKPITFVDIKTILRQAFVMEAPSVLKRKRKGGMFVRFPAPGARSNCERPQPLLGNIIHQGGLKPDTGENCLHTLSINLWVQMQIPFSAGISC